MGAAPPAGHHCQAGQLSWPWAGASWEADASSSKMVNPFQGARAGGLPIGAGQTSGSSDTWKLKWDNPFAGLSSRVLSLLSPHTCCLTVRLDLDTGSFWKLSV